MISFSGLPKLYRQSFCTIKHVKELFVIGIDYHFLQFKACKNVQQVYEVCAA